MPGVQVCERAPMRSLLMLEESAPSSRVQENPRLETHINSLLESPRHILTRRVHEALPRKTIYLSAPELPQASLNENEHENEHRGPKNKKNERTNERANELTDTHQLIAPPKTHAKEPSIPRSGMFEKDRILPRPSHPIPNTKKKKGPGACSSATSPYTLETRQARTLS